MRLGYLDILDDEQSKKAVDLEDKIEKLWIRRAPVPMDFFTIGAVTYMEGVTSIKTVSYTHLTLPTKA